MDLISRQAAIDAMAELQGRASTKAELKGISKAWKRIKQLPSSQQEQRWVPVSERLPEQDQICLICGKNGGVYVARFWRNETLILWTKTGTGKFVKAVAWMPLPAPYRPEGEEHERA